MQLRPLHYGFGDRRRAARIAVVLTAMLGCASSTRAQQNLFNVPSAEITPEDGIFFQQQFNLSHFGQSNTTIDYGLGGQLEIGLNVLDVPLYSSGEEVPSSADQSDVLLNFQKAFELTDRLRVGVGSQLGVSSASSQGRADFLDFNWLTTAIAASRATFYVGAYHGNRSYLGEGSNVGVFLGIDAPIVEDQLHFVGDYIIGTNDLGVAVLGGVLMLPRNWQLSLGMQLPSPNSGNSEGLVLELTRVPAPVDRRAKSSAEQAL